MLENGGQILWCDGVGDDTAIRVNREFVSELLADILSGCTKWTSLFNTVITMNRISDITKCHNGGQRTDGTMP